MRWRLPLYVRASSELSGISGHMSHSQDPGRRRLGRMSYPQNGFRAALFCFPRFGQMGPEHFSYRMGFGQNRARGVSLSWLVFRWLWVTNRYPRWNPGKWKHGPKSAVCWFNFDPPPNPVPDSWGFPALRGARLVGKPRPVGWPSGDLPAEGQADAQGGRAAGRRRHRAGPLGRHHRFDRRDRRGRRGPGGQDPG